MPERAGDVAVGQTFSRCMNEPVHVTYWTGDGTLMNPRVAVCLGCRWTCAGAHERVVEAMRRHEEAPHVH